MQRTNSKKSDFDELLFETETKHTYTHTPNDVIIIKSTIIFFFVAWIHLYAYVLSFILSFWFSLFSALLGTSSYTTSPSIYVYQIKKMKKKNTFVHTVVVGNFLFVFVHARKHAKSVAHAFNRLIICAHVKSRTIHAWTLHNYRGKIENHSAFICSRDSLPANVCNRAWKEWIVFTDDAVVAVFPQYSLRSMPYLWQVRWQKKNYYR